MIAALLLNLAQTAAPTPSSELTPELLVAHPGLRSADYAQVVEDQLAALEAAPDSPWAAAAVASIQMLEAYCAEGLDPARLERLADAVRDGDAEHGLKLLLEREIARRRFSEQPYPSAEDLHPDFVDDWFVLGPFGPLGEPAPLWGAPSQEAPSVALRSEFASASGGPLVWRAARRERNHYGFLPEREVHPGAGGTLWLLAWIEAPVEGALLEVHTTRAVQAWWNGELVLEELRGGLTRTEERLVAPVRLAPGANALLLRLENGEQELVGARLLDLEGNRLPVPVTSSSEAPVRPWPRVEGDAVLSRIAPLPADVPFASCVAMLLDVSRERADRALAAPEPESAEELPAWLRLRHLACRSAHHLPGEVHRRFQLEIEQRLAALDVTYPEIEWFRAERMIDEDRPREALAIMESLVEAHPKVPPFHWLRNHALSVIDPSNVMARKALRETLEHVDDAESWSQLADEASERLDAAAVLEYRTRAAAADGGDDGYAQSLLERLLTGNEADLRRAERMIERWRRDEPWADWLDDSELRVLEQRGQTGEIERRLARRVEERPFVPWTWSRLASHHLRHGRHDAARDELRRILALTPDQNWARQALEQLGERDEAEDFFREFEPDREAALAGRETASGASTALVLDSRMVFVREDGSTHSRTQQITLAVDRTGTEMLQQQGDRGATRVARVIDADGSHYEPILVEGSWVMPSLDPGDSVELVWDEFTGATHEAAPSLGIWSFESFEQPFLVSRYVVFLPAGVPGRFDVSAFDGEHRELPWRDGTVHVFETHDRERLEPERMMPSPRELTTWVEYGDDVPSAYVAQSAAVSFAWRQDTADDVRAELEAFVERVRAEADPAELPRALYDAVSEHVLDYSSEGDTTDVWYLERGNPAGLLASLFDIAGIPYEWAASYPATAPELDPDPRRPFETPADTGPAWLRVVEADGRVTWLLAELPRGCPYGRVPEQAGGTRVLVLGSDGPRFETLERVSADEWMANLEIDVYLQEEKAARVEARLVISDLAGPLTREFLSQLEPQQREQVVRQIASGLIGGIDLGEWELHDLRERGADTVLTLEGTLERFVRGGGKKPYCKLGWEEHDVAKLVGDGERRWPFAARAHQTDRKVLRIHPSEAFRLDEPPESLAVERDGLHYSIEFELVDGVLEVTKELRLHALELAAEDVAEFAREVKELEDLDSARIRLVPVD